MKAARGRSGEQASTSEPVSATAAVTSVMAMSTSNQTRADCCAVQVMPGLPAAWRAWLARVRKTESVIARATWAPGDWARRAESVETIADLSTR